MWLNVTEKDQGAHSYMTQKLLAAVGLVKSTVCVKEALKAKIAS